MRRIIMIALAGAAMGGCSSLSDTFKTAPTPVTIQMNSVPQGADARLSLGQNCTTPCSLTLTTEATAFDVIYTLDKFETQTVPVQVVRNPGDFTTPATTVLNPNPVVAELVAVKKPQKKRRAAPKRAAVPAAAADTATTASSPFPSPTR